MLWTRSNRFCSWMILAWVIGVAEASQGQSTTRQPLPPALPAPGPSPVAGLQGEPLTPSLSELPVPGLPGGQAGAPINLATALQLAGVRPLDIAAATASVEQSLGLLLQAKALKLPNLNGGVDYYRHDGINQNLFTGQAFRKDTNALFVGGGPSLNVGVTDAIFAPLAARRIVDSRRADVQAARNNSVYNVAQAFFALQEARGRLGGIERTSSKADQLVTLTRQLSPGLVAPLEFNRALAESLSLMQDVEVARRD